MSDLLKMLQRLWIIYIIFLLLSLNVEAKSTKLEESLKHHSKNLAWQHFKERFKKSNTLYYTPSSRWKYLGTSAGILGISLVIGIVGLYLMPESVTNWDKQHFGVKSWFEDVRMGPRLDNDSFIFNEVLHPYFGAMYYMQPRMAGFSWMASALFSFVMSTAFWEYGLEAFVEIPSWQDLIITPLLGSLLGEGFYQLTRRIQNNGGKLFGSLFLGRLVIALMDPIGFIIRDLGLGEALGIYNKNEWHSSLSPSGLNITYKF
ncbi:DUF3943 domain-containing protein [Helicobacter cetorum]|uniref:DUF3943 domain-containing protein n=1 Tax=Helicobacter cetorum (strain ATCC BAA-429 / MIT 00-7128) TaxID=182217 RepID=I0ENC9_HELC0|nr:DUF3943 domain-containing protein [Helicobacter cetorum]AFI04448.1 hypothetical protein HCW_05930 [Helicobacter cetorum MIT 00-7128]